MSMNINVSVALGMHISDGKSYKGGAVYIFGNKKYSNKGMFCYICQYTFFFFFWERPCNLSTINWPKPNPKPDK